MRFIGLIPIRYNQCDEETKSNLDKILDNPDYDKMRNKHFGDLEGRDNYKVRQNQIPKWLVASAMGIDKIISSTSTDKANNE